MLRENDALLSKGNSFGVWNGVFPTCFVNIFGVVVFLRAGWIIANVGIELTILVILLTEAVALVTALSAIGICRKANLVCESGIYTMLSYVFGSNIGVPVTLLFCLSQAASCSLCAVGFSESMSNLIGIQNLWIQKAIAVVTILILVGIMLLGLTWFIWLQMLLILLFLIATFDFLIGSFISINIPLGITGYKFETLKNNSGPLYSEGENFFSILGIFFPMCCGILAGFNMSPNIQNPLLNIPKGTLITIAVCSIFYILFALVLASTCERNSLLTNFNLPEEICVSRILYLIGLHQWSLSSAVGGLSGPPQLLQSMSANSGFCLLKPIAFMHQSSMNPVGAIILHSMFSISFIFIGSLNSLGYIITVPCLITYATVNFAQFVLSIYIDCHGNVSTFELNANQNARLYTATSNELDHRLNPETNDIKPDYTDSIEIETDSIDSLNGADKLTCADDETLKLDIAESYSSENDITLLKETTDNADCKLAKSLNITNEDADNYTQLDSNSNALVKCKESTDVNELPSLYCTKNIQTCSNVNLISEDSLQRRDVNNNLNLYLKILLDAVSNIGEPTLEGGRARHGDWKYFENIVHNKTDNENSNLEQIVKNAICKIVNNRWISLTGAVGCLVSSFLIHWIYALSSCFFICIYCSISKVLLKNYLEKIKNTKENL